MCERVRVLGLMRLSFFAGAVLTASLSALAADAPTYRPSSANQPPVYQPKTVPPVSGQPVVMSPAARAACKSLEDMIAVVRRSRMTVNGEILPDEKGVAFASPGAVSCSAKSGLDVGSSRASCLYAAKDKADAGAKRLQLIAHTKDCLIGWPNGSTTDSFMYQSADRMVSGSVQIVEKDGKTFVERSAYYDAVRNPVALANTCSTFHGMQKLVAENFAGTQLRQLASGANELTSPVAHSNLCYAFPRQSPSPVAGLSCTWIVEDKDPKGPGKEVLARSFYKSAMKLVTTCRPSQAAQAQAELGRGELGSFSTSNGKELWSVKLLGPEKGAPWAVMLTVKQK